MNAGDGGGSVDGLPAVHISEGRCRGGGVGGSALSSSSSSHRRKRASDVHDRRRRLADRRVLRLEPGLAQLPRRLVAPLRQGGVGLLELYCSFGEEGVDDGPVICDVELERRLARVVHQVIRKGFAVVEEVDDVHVALVSQRPRVYSQRCSIWAFYPASWAVLDADCCSNVNVVY